MAKVIQLSNIKRALKLEPADSINYLISGRVRNFRVYKSFNFIDLIDGSTNEHLQVVVNKNLLKKPQLGSYLICQGNIAPSPGSQQKIEFKANQVKYASLCDPEKWPLADTKKSELTDGWFRRHLHLRPQADHFASLLRVRSELELSLHMIFKQMDFFKVHTPILSSNDSEASSDLFMVLRHKQSPASQVHVDNDDKQEGVQHDSQARGQDNETVPQSGTATMNKARGYFNKDVFMATSAQLHLEALAASLSRVYCLSSAFRAESSLSRRHLCEFTMLEAEEANVSRLEPLMDRVESILKFSAQFVSEVSEFSSDFHKLSDKYSNHDVYEKLAHKRYIRMKYEEAMKVLRDLHSTPAGTRLLSADLPLSDCHYGCELGRRHERHLLSHCNNVPIFITNYPRRLKPFYMKCAEEVGGSEALCFDLIAPFGGEICGGSLREDDPVKLRQELRSLHKQQLQTETHDNNRNMGHEQTRDHNNATARGGATDAASRRKQINPDFQWYLDLREFGSFPHGGFGIGFERLIQSLLGLPNIRDTIAFPRSAGSCPM